MPPFPSLGFLQTLSDVYANVVDYGAGPLKSPTENYAAIQAAIATGKHVLFPGNSQNPFSTYQFEGVLTFANAAQQCTVLANAILEPLNESSYVLITGSGQVFRGLRIEVPLRSAHSPVLDIYGASDLVMHDLCVSVVEMASSVAGPRAAVRLMGLTNCTMLGGRISGGGESGTVGLWLASSYDYFYTDENGAEQRGPGAGEWSNPLTFDEFVAAKGTSGAYEVSVVGLRIEAFGWAVRVGCITDSPKFISCVFADNADGALVVTGDADVVTADPWTQATSTQLWECPTPSSAYGLTLVDCHFQGGTAQQCVEIAETCRWIGGAVLGCTFGFVGLQDLDAEIDLGAGIVRAPLSATLAQPVPPADSVRVTGAGVGPGSAPGANGTLNASDLPTLANTAISVGGSDVRSGVDSPNVSSDRTNPGAATAPASTVGSSQPQSSESAGGVLQLTTPSSGSGPVGSELPSALDYVSAPTVGQTLGASVSASSSGSGATRSGSAPTNLPPGGSSTFATGRTASASPKVVSAPVSNTATSRTPVHLLPPGILATLAQTSRTAGVLAIAASGGRSTGSQSPMARLLRSPSILPRMFHSRASGASRSVSMTQWAKSVVASSRSRVVSGSGRASAVGIGDAPLTSGIALASGIALDVGDARCIFRIEGIAEGVLVNGCQSDAAIADYVWIIPESGQLENTGDAFNTWAQSVVAVGANAGLLVRLSTDAVSVSVPADPPTDPPTEVDVVELTVLAPAVSFAASKHRFFGSDPTSQDAEAFSVGVPGTRSLSSSADLATVLAQLIADLAALGLIQQGGT